jgi:hypothetical protein
VLREPVKKPPPVQQKHVREPPPVRHDDVHEGGELGHHDVADRDQGVPHANEGDSVPVQEGGGDGAADDPVDQGHGVCDGDAHDGGQDRPKKPPDAGYTKLKMIGPGLQRSGLMVMILMLMMNPALILRRSVLVLKTGSVMVSPMISDIIQMETSNDDSKPFDGGGN